MFSMISMFSMHVHVCVCMHVHVCVHGTPPHIPTPTPIPKHPSATPRISKNSITLELIKIFKFCLKILKFVKNSPPMGGWVVGWVDGWDPVKTLKI